MAHLFDPALAAAELDLLERFEAKLKDSGVGQAGQDFVSAYIHGARKGILWLATTGGTERPMEFLLTALQERAKKEG